MSAALTARSVRPRRPASVSAVWTAPAARIDGTGSRSSDQAASLTGRASSAPRPARPRRPRRQTVEGRVQPAGPGRRRPRSRRASRTRSGARSAPSSPSRSTTIGRARRTRPRAARRPAEERRPPAELDPQVHHDPLALGVDGGVRDLGERLAQVVGDRPVEPAAARRRRVVAHAPERLVALERHRLDVEPARARRRARRDSAGRGRSAVVPRAAAPRPDLPSGPRGPAAAASWIGSARQGPGLRLGVLEDRARGAGSTSSSSPGPRRPRRIVSAAVNGHRARPRRRRRPAGRGSPRRPPVAARCDRPARRPAGRRRRRSPPARPTARATRPSGDGASPTCGCGARRSASASGIAASRAGVSSQPVVVSSSSASSSDSESEPSGESSGPAARSSRARSRLAPRSRGPAADLLAVAAHGVDLAVVGDRAERLREAPDGMGVGRVALVEDRVADRQRRPQVGIEVGNRAPLARRVFSARLVCSGQLPASLDKRRWKR